VLSPGDPHLCPEYCCTILSAHCVTQILPFADPLVLGLHEQFENTVRTL
jgi:hypothetical protein